MLKHLAHYCRGKHRGKGNQGRYRKEEDQNRLRQRARNQAKLHHASGQQYAGPSPCSSFWDMRLSIACAVPSTRTASSSTTTPATSPSWRGSPIRTPTTRRMRRRAALPAPRGPALVCRSLDTRSSQLHAAACPACCTAP